MNTALITGSSGLVGSACVAYYHRLGWRVVGADNNQRLDLFGPDGDTSGNLERLRAECPGFEARTLDVRDRAGVAALVEAERPRLIVHCAAQPSHDLAARRPFDDFDINAGGTLALLEAARQFCPETPFVFLSTNKVYGDAPNRLELVERPTRWEYAHQEDWYGIDESCDIDASLHSLFGVSKAAADLLVQEYGRYFGLPTICFRCGCLTGGQHAGAELHGFLAYVARCLREGRPYRIFGYGGKQVRDNLHASDVCEAIEAFRQAPQPAAVFNLGGGRQNSTSVMEAIVALEDRMGRRLQTEYVDEARKGDHICYISDLRRFQTAYPQWRPRRSLDSIFTELAGGKAWSLSA